MYHALILETVLDLINAGQLYAPVIDNDLGMLRETAQRMLSWLSKMVHPDGKIAFFNDAAFGIAPDFVQLADYALRLGLKSVNVPLGESGYIRLEIGESMVLFDAGAIGPDHQPGHAHADTLSFELSLNGPAHNCKLGNLDL